MRLALSILAACGFAFLTACGSGFSGSTNSTTPSIVVLSPNAGMADDFFITPGGTAPLSVAAISYTGSGAFNTVVPDVTYTWAARFVNPLTDPMSVATYLTGAAPNAFKSCPAKPESTPPVPILVQYGSGTPSSLYPSYTVLPSAATAIQVFVGPVPGVAAPYCLVVQATSVPGGVVGTATAIVSFSP
jgi:hypothetical protein